MNLGERIKQLRLEKNYYQVEIANFLHVTIGTISNYENGVHNPDVETLCKLAEYFEVSVDYLLGRTDFRKPIDALSQPLVKDYMAVDILNTTLGLTPENRAALVSYLDYLNAKNGQEIGKKQA